MKTDIIFCQMINYLRILISKHSGLLCFRQWIFTVLPLHESTCSLQNGGNRGALLLNPKNFLVDLLFAFPFLPQSFSTFENLRRSTNALLHRKCPRYKPDCYNSSQSTTALCYWSSFPIYLKPVMRANCQEKGRRMRKIRVWEDHSCWEVELSHARPLCCLSWSSNLSLSG